MTTLLILGSKPDPALPPRSAYQDVACANASGKEIASDHSVSVKFCRLRRYCAIPTDHDSVDPVLRLVQLSFAMPFQ